MEKKNNFEKIGEIYSIMKEVREDILKTMEEKKIDKIEFCPDADDYEDSEHDDLDYYEYRDAKCPFVFFYCKYGGAFEYAIKSVWTEDCKSGDKQFVFYCEGIDTCEHPTLYEWDIMFYSMIDVYESISRELGI